MRDLAQNGSLRVAHVSSEDQLADALTKPLPRTRFQILKSKIGLSDRAPSSGGIIEKESTPYLSLTVTAVHIFHFVF